MKKYALLLIVIVFLCSAGVIAEVTSIIDLPAETAGDTIAIFLSGDGGWRKIDKDISATLTKQGVYVVGINSMRYFWKKRTPEETASDINILIDSYMIKTGRKKIILIGYSFGADVVPFIISRLPEKTLSNVAGGVLLGVSSDAFFEVSADEWLGKIKGDYATLPEILKINKIPLLLVEGTDDDHEVIRNLDPEKYKIVLIDGGHHFDGDYNKLAWIIIDWCKIIDRENKPAGKNR